MIEALMDVDVDSTSTRIENVFKALDIADSAVEKHKVGLTILVNRALSKMGKTQAQRASALGVAQPVISNLERYELAGISSDRLLRYCEQLDVEVAPPVAVR